MAARIPVRPDAADCLNLDTKPTVHYYMPFGSDHGKLVFLSKRPMSKQLLEKLRRVIEAMRKGPSFPAKR